MLIALQGCATAEKNSSPVVTVSTEDQPAAAVKTPEQQRAEQMAAMQERIQELETRLTAMNEKVNQKLSTFTCSTTSSP